MASATSRTRPNLLLLVLLIVGLALMMVVMGLGLGPALAPPTPTPTIEGVTAVVPPIVLDDFTLTNERGEAVNLESLQGKPTLIFFGYTHCPDFCPTTMANMKRVHEALGPDGDKLNYIFVSVDGQRDTHDLLANYLNVRGVADFMTALTGSEDAVRAWGEKFGIFFEVNAATANLENYLVDHSTRSYLLDRNAQLSVIYSYNTDPAIMADNIRLFL